MDIGPISAIRPVTMIKPSAAAPDLSRVFEVEYLGQSSDDEYTPHRKAGRGLEDKDQEEEPDATEFEMSEAANFSGKVSFFA
ncbi:MAG TPA: hypothetical protein VGL00_09650 [Terracidiphilus sp.]|jgi:hypothetical protein